MKNRMEEATTTGGSMTRLDLTIAWFLAAVFVFAGLDKVVHWHGFINALNDYRIVPLAAVAMLAPLIVAAELTVGVGLLVGSWRRPAALAAALLIALLSVALATNRLAGGRGICGCWFSINAAPEGLHMVLNGILFLLSLLVWSAAKSGRDAARVPLVCKGDGR